MFKKLYELFHYKHIINTYKILDTEDKFLSLLLIMSFMIMIPCGIILLFLLIQAIITSFLEFVIGLPIILILGYIATIITSNIVNKAKL